MLTPLMPTATTLIRLDHTHTLLTMRRYHADTPPSIKRGLADTVCLALEVHATLEEEIFYPALRNAGANSPALDKSVPEHDEMRRLIAELRATDAADAAHATVFMSLMRDVLHHVADEETVLLPTAERVLADQLRPLGGQMLLRRTQLVAPRTGELVVNLTRATPAWKLVLMAEAALAGAAAVAKAARPRHKRLGHR